MIPVFKGKGLMQECSNYRSIKMMNDPSSSVTESSTPGFDCSALSRSVKMGSGPAMIHGPYFRS